LLEEDECEAFRKAEKLDRLNEERREIERKLLDEAMREIEAQCDLENEKVVVCAGRGWHVGIIGIVAARVLDHFFRPSIVCAIDGADDIAKGSGRSIDGFNLHQALTDCSDLLLGFGGHAHAAGLRLEAAKLPEFRAAINELANKRLNDDDLIPSLAIDAEVEFEELDLDAARALEELAPFGQSNEQPLLVTRGARVEGYPRVVGRNHLKMRVRRGSAPPMEVIGFGQADQMRVLMNGLREIDLCGVPTLNHFRGATTLQFELKAMRPSVGEAMPAMI
jgi:single-stranded-DNA-specific exonuclease